MWPNFRFGLKPGEPFPDSQFPLGAVDELSKQGVPDVSFGGLPTPNPNFKALSDLAGQLNGAVLMGHSQSGSFPLEAALLNPAATRGLVLVEPGRCPAYTPEQIATLVKVPLLVVFGDHRDNPTGLPTLPTWQARFEACQALIARLRSAGGQAEMLNPPERGIRGNSHMIMQDKNSFQIADLILKWIDRARSASPHARLPFMGEVRRGTVPLAWLLAILASATPLRAQEPERPPPRYCPRRTSGSCASRWSSRTAGGREPACAARTSPCSRTATRRR